jgi:uncharacterized protein (TIGR02246 family)
MTQQRSNPLNHLRRLIITSLALVVVTALPSALNAGHQGTPPVSSEADETAVRAVLERQLAAWAAGDGTAFGATVTEDSDLITFDGTHVTGRQTIASYMQQAFDTVLADTRVEAAPVRIRFLNDDTAVMITEGGVVFPGEAEVPSERFSIQTFVLTKQDGQWLIEAFQNTRIDPATRGD